MPLTAMHATARKDGEIVEYRLAPDARLFAGALVCVDTASGLALAGTDAANRVFVGVAQNGSVPGMAGVKVWKRGTFLFAVANAAPALVGKTAVLVDDGRVSTGATGQNIPVGVVVGIEGGMARVRIDGAVR